MGIRRYTALALLLVTAPVVPVAAQRAAARAAGRIVGVFDEETGKPVAGAEVIDLFVGATAHTEAHGLVELSNFQHRNDSAAVHIRKIGYADTSLVVMVGPSDTIPVEIDVHRAAIDLPALISHATVTTTRAASPLLDEFESRRKMGFGYFMDGAELRTRADDHVFADYLASRFPAMRLVYSGAKVMIAAARGGCSGLVFTCGGFGQCAASVYIDGVAVYTPGSSTDGPPDFSLYHAEEFAAVEWYAGVSTVPAEYSKTGSQCGVLLLWRRYNTVP